MNPEQNGGQPAQVPPQYPNQNPVPPTAPQPPVTGSVPPVGGNPYDFILNPEKPQKKPLLTGGNSMLQRVAIVGGGFMLLIIVFIVGMSLLTSSGREKTEDLLAVAQEQTELIRVASDGAKRATTLPVQNLAQNVQASVTSDNQALLTYMKNNGQKVGAKELALKHSKTTDTTLTTALENNTYDTAFKDVIQKDLASYRTALQKAFKANPGPKGQELLSKQFDAATLLLKVSQQ